MRWGKQERRMCEGCKWGVVSEKERVQNGQLLFADDTAMVASSDERLQRLVDECGVVCKKRKLKMNVGKSKILLCSRERGRAELNVCLNGEVMGEVES